MSIKPLVFLGPTSKKLLENILLTRLQAWVDSWAVEHIEYNLTSLEKTRTIETEAKKVYKHSNSSGEILGYSLFDKNQLTHFSSAVFLAQQTKPINANASPIVASVIKTSISELFGGLADLGEQALVIEEISTSENPSCLEHTFIVTFMIAGSELSIVLPADLIRQTYQSPSKPNNNDDELMKLVENQTVASQVVVGNVQLTVDMLTQLNTGDIIQMDKKLNEPMLLVLNNSEVEMTGYLGKRNEHYAFKVNQ